MLRGENTRHHRRLLPPVVFALGVLLAMHAAAARFDTLQVTQQGDSYRIHGEVYLDAVPQAVYAQLIDFPRLPEINPSVRVSRVLKVINAHSQLVYTETAGCVFIFCHTLRQVQRFTELGPQDIVAVTVPGSGDVKHGRSSWHLQAEGDGTRLSWTVSIEPDFWVPPFIGPRAIENQLRNQALESMQAIERLAEEQAEMIPNARMSI
ncbi:MAG TPA: SRPBCC family protein [Gammaproteobacteria bacterium]|nr:SRPBCC family protein [Gammaproteobacteria bacterium]